MTNVPLVRPARAVPAVDTGIRVVAVAGLAVSAYVHLHLAGGYRFGGGITGADLFYAQGVAAAVVGLWLVGTGARLAWWAAALLAAASLAAVLTYRYVDVGSLGPLPNMYEPIWFTEKTLSAGAEAAVVVLSLVHVVTRRRRR